MLRDGGKREKLKCICRELNNPMPPGGSIGKGSLLSEHVYLSGYSVREVSGMLGVMVEYGL